MAGGGGRTEDGIARPSERRPQRTRARRRRRARGLVLLVLLLAVLGVGGFLVWDTFVREPGVYDDAEGTGLPPLPDDAPAVQGYLAGPEGQALAGATAAVAPLLDDDANAATCTAVIAALDALGTPDDVFSWATRIPDGATAEMAVRHFSAATTLLGRCLEDGELPTRSELRFTSTILERRLEELA